MESSCSFRIALILSVCVLMVQASDDVIRDDGDVMLASLFEVNEAGSDAMTCGDFDVAGVRSAYAVQWFVRQLNQNNYIPGVTIGLETWRRCYSHVRAMRALIRLIDTYVTNSSAEARLAGLIGPSRTEPAVEVSETFSSLPENQRVPQVSGSATGIALGNYSNFFRVIPPDGAQIKVIRELLLTLRWNYIALIYTDEEYGRSAAAALLQEVKGHGVCVPVYASIPTDTSSKQFTTAVEDVAERIKIKPSAGVSSYVWGAVFIGGKKEAQQFAITLSNKASYVKLIFSEALALQTSALKKENQDTVIGVAKGALTVTPQYRRVDEFRQAWNQLWQNCSNPPAEVTGNVWLNSLRDKFSGDCSRLQLGARDQMLFTWYHVQAAAVFAAALKALHSEACPDAPGPCPAFMNLVHNYERIKRVWRSGLNLEAEFNNTVASFKGLTNVNFDDEGEVVINSSQPVYEIYNFSSCLDNKEEFCFVKVGDTWEKGHLTLNLTLPWEEVDKAQCGHDRDCLECVPIRPCDATLLIQGDFYFVAVVPVHSRDPDDSLQCGKPRPSLGADFVQAIQYALDEVNREGGRWRSVMPGKTLGAIVFDSCFSPLVVKNKLLQLHKGHIMTPTGPMNETYVKDVLLKRIAGYIGGYFSVISFAMSDILTKLNRESYVHLSPTSLASGLSDRKEHPYFMRLTMPAKYELLAMMDMLKTLSATFVQIIYDPVDDYSADLTEEFEKKAVEYGVCVAQKIEATLQSDPILYFSILRDLRKKSSARMVIVILQYEQILQVMDVLISNENPLKRQDSFVFFGPEVWGRRPGIIAGKQRLAGSLTVAEEIALDSQFTEYFTTVEPQDTTNFWLRDYWESRGDCYFDRSFTRKGKKQECGPDIQKAYVQDPWVSYYIQSVYAFASGVGRALNDTCSSSEENICSALKASTLVDYMKQVKLDLFNRGTEQRVFDDNGDGKNGYKVLQAYHSGAGEMRYRQIGTWTKGGGLALSVTVADLYTRLPLDIEARNYNSSCSSEVECQICPSSKRDKATKDEQTMPMIPAVVVIAILVIIVVILIAAVIIVSRRRRRKPKTQPTCDIKFENDGLSTLSSVSNQPVQEMYRQASRPSPLPEDCSSEDPSDGYEFLNAPTPPATPILERPPTPCTMGSKADYLTPRELPQDN